MEIYFSGLYLASKLYHNLGFWAFWRKKITYKHFFVILGPLPRRPHKSSVIMNELDQLRAEAEQLKNAIRVRFSVQKFRQIKVITKDFQIFQQFYQS